MTVKPEGVRLALCGSSLVFERVVEAGGGVPGNKGVTGETLAGTLAIWLGSTITPGAAGADVEVCKGADAAEATLPGWLLAAPFAWAF